MQTRWVVLCCASALVLGALFGRYGTPQRVLEKDRIVTVDREVETHWAAYVGHTETRKETNTVWVTRETRRPDGTVEIETKGQQGVVEETKKDEARQEATVKEVVKYVDKETIRNVENPRADWFFAGHAGLTTDKTSIYGGEVFRRILGPIFVGAWAQRGGAWTGGVSVGAEW